MRMIEHLVISGAGPNGLMQLGVIEVFISQKLLNVSSLKSVHGVSAGAVFGCLLLLGIPNHVTSKYFIQRPWAKWFQPDITQFQCIRGCMDSATFASAIAPLFLAYDIPLDITLKDLHDMSGVDLYIGVTLADTMTYADITHVTHPSLPVMTACSMTCAIFPVFSPVEWNGAVYMDGCFSNDFPAQRCLEMGGNPETLLAISMVNESIQFGNAEDKPWIEYIMHVFMKSMRKLQFTEINVCAANKCKYFVQIVARSITDISLWEDFTKCESNRQLMYDNGVGVANKFLAELYAVSDAQNSQKFEISSDKYSNPTSACQINYKEESPRTTSDPSILE